MAMSSLAAAKSKSFLSRLKTLLTFQNFNHTLTEMCPPPVFERDDGVGEIEFSKWRKLDARKMGINQSMIPMSPWIVLKILKNEGFEAYFVGGCVRDLVLKRVPKDFDVITSAALTQVRKKFHRSMIIGRRFPICQVNIKGSVVEVSSFQTRAQHNDGKDGKFSVSQLPKGCDKKDLGRWRNCMHRDFTVNSLFFDPFVNKIYDYADALSDLKLSKLRTLIPAKLSFEEDCARILRALRLAARLGLSFSEDTESAIHKLSSSILSLAKSRILMELNYMLSYGAAEPSLSLLRRFHLLEILLPLQEAHLTQQAHISGQSPSMLMKLFSNLDKLVSCDRPADSSLWVAILAFHLALISNPQHPLVVLTVASVLFHGKWEEGVKFARQHAQEVQIYIPEIASCSDSISDDELADKVSELAVQVQNSVCFLSEAEILLKEMAKFPAFECPGLVFVPKKLGASAKQIFDVLVRDLTFLRTKRASMEINYDSLKKGNAREARFVLGQIILHTLGCELVIGDEVMRKDKIRLHALDPEKNAEILAENSPLVVDQRKKTDTKRTVKAANFAEEQVVSKKQKLFEKIGGLSELGRDMDQMLTADTESMDLDGKKQDLLEDDSCSEVAKKCRKGKSKETGSLLQVYASKMLEKADSHGVPREEIKSMLETLKFQAGKHEAPVKEQKTSGDEEYKKSAEKHLKLLEQVNNDVARKQPKSKESCLLHQEPDTEQQNVVVEYIGGNVHQNRRVLEKGVNHKNEKLEGRPQTLSSLFK
ncbi:uncharacterized protein LOC113778863 isoform X1 [Coffea eugenioides]|uniref:uncharacterized protein LOC113778863 isoform X1 n=2 Tax=Coffea eugenioides TaxID=49369 RepID=UPI000F60A7D5|nr:uncharacterized protein LOC113778863 isoform X1 [Coffea eugenioides]